LRRKAEWWRIDGVKPPSYNNLGRRNSRLDVWIGLGILSSIIGEVAGILPRGFSILATSIGILFEFLASILGFNRRGPGLKEEVFLSELLKTLQDKIAYWAIPCPRIPLVASLITGLYMIVYRKGRDYMAALVKPIVIQRIIGCNCTFKNKKKRRFWKTIFPHPYIKGYCYSVLGILAASALTLEPRILVSRLEREVERLENTIDR
jgi:hypothetical protein